MVDIMSRRPLMILLLFGFGLAQIHAQSEEAEAVYDEILAGEGSGSHVLHDVTTDDEDMVDYSGAESSGKGEDDYDHGNSRNTDVDKGDDSDTEEDSNDIDANIDLMEEEPKDVTTDEHFMGSSPFIAAIVIGGSVGLLFAICVILLVVYRMRKKDEGSYAIDDEKKPANNYPYTQGQEYFA